ncbi:unnamed protein product [Ascophyllum nodosum]
MECIMYNVLYTSRCCRHSWRGAYPWGPSLPFLFHAELGGTIHRIRQSTIICPPPRLRTSFDIICVTHPKSIYVVYALTIPNVFLKSYYGMTAESCLFCTVIFCPSPSTRAPWSLSYLARYARPSAATPFRSSPTHHGVV